jgi:hypothetical protein
MFVFMLNPSPPVGEYESNDLTTWAIPPLISLLSGMLLMGCKNIKKWGF